MNLTQAIISQECKPAYLDTRILKNVFIMLTSAEYKMNNTYGNFHMPILKYQKHRLSVSI
jgi:hypothetical protein